MRFDLGHVVTTRGVQDLMEVRKQGDLFKQLLNRHSQCDWGSLDEEDQAYNNSNFEKDTDLKKGTLMSVYKVEDQTIWIITEWDRSVTTLLLPSEY